MVGIGSRVTEIKYGYTGRVVQMYDDFSAVSASCCSMTGEEWLDRQTIPFTEEARSERWFTVECDGGGAIWAPESHLEEICGTEQVG